MNEYQCILLLYCNNTIPLGVVIILRDHCASGMSEHFTKRAIGEVIQLANCYNSYRVATESLVKKLELKKDELDSLVLLGLE